MRSTRLRPTALALILTLTALPAVAGKGPPRPSKAPSLLTWVLQAFERLLPAIAEGGHGMDPNGGDGPATSTTPAPEDDNDGRGTMDPDGSDPNA